MKAFAGFNLPVGTQELLRERAASADVPISHLVDVCLRYALEKLDSAKVARVGAEYRRANLPRKERLCLEAYDRLREKHAEMDEPWKFRRAFTKREFARVSGLYPCEVLQGLRGLERAGLLKSMMAGDVTAPVLNGEHPEAEHWFRPEK